MLSFIIVVLVMTSFHSQKQGLRQGTIQPAQICGYCLQLLLCDGSHNEGL